MGHCRRHGRLELLVVLGDGSKRLIPAEWTDHDQPETTAREGVCAAVPQTLGTTADLLVVCGLVSALLAREVGDGEQAAGKSPSEEDFHAACHSSVCPMPDQAPDTPEAILLPTGWRRRAPCRPSGRQGATCWRAETANRRDGPSREAGPRR